MCWFAADGQPSQRGNSFSNFAVVALARTELQKVLARGKAAVRHEKLDRTDYG
jgi:hypothetical protein